MQAHEKPVPFVNEDGRGVVVERGTWERGNWLICKINERNVI